MNGKTQWVIPAGVAIAIVAGAYTVGTTTADSAAGIDALENRVEALDSEISGLEDRVENLSKKQSLLEYQVDQMQGKLSHE